jgi:hypothetical protein
MPDTALQNTDQESQPISETETTKSPIYNTTPTSSPAYTSGTSDITNTINSIFSSSNITLFLWILAAYFITYVIIGLFSPSSSGPMFILKLMDALILIAIFSYIISYYHYNKPGDSDTINSIKQNTYNTLNDPYTLLYTGIFLAVYTSIVFVFHIPTTGLDAPVSLWLASSIAWIVFTISAIVVFCNYVLGFSILDSDLFTSFWNNKKQDESTKKDKKQTQANKQTDEVFNVSNNLYTYDDARAVCSAYGARLATYDEIEGAYNNGGEWCSYGWSEGQMAYFPTQKSTWNKLQKNPKTKNNCGRPGVNGGYMENPYLKFGVNCFGQKPKATDKDLQAMKTNQLQPKTEEDLLMDKKVQFWKENADKLLNVNSFNKTKWSEY